MLASCEWDGHPGFDCEAGKLTAGSERVKVHLPSVSEQGRQNVKFERVHKFLERFVREDRSACKAHEKMSLATREMEVKTAASYHGYSGKDTQ